MPVALSDLQILPFNQEKYDVTSFDCGDADLNDFLRNDASRYQREHLSHTRLALLNGELAGYITLLADCIVLKTPEKRRLIDFHRSVYSFPALKIGRLGVQQKLQGTGVGTQLLHYTIGVVIRLNREMNVGCRFITLDAYPKSVSWYQKKGFVFNKYYREPEKTHPSMRYDILKTPEIR